MGYGLPAAIAAGLVHRDRAVVALVGDGGFGMTLAEVETAVRNGLRTVILVFDNQRYGMIRTYQDRRPGAAGGRDGPRADRLRGGGTGARRAGRQGRGRRVGRAGHLSSVINRTIITYYYLARKSFCLYYNISYGICLVKCWDANNYTVIVLHKDDTIRDYYIRFRPYFSFWGYRGWGYRGC